MKKIIICLFIFTGCVCLFSCNGDKKALPNEPKPLNISIYLDLSDRVVREGEPNQTYRDTAIVNFLVDYFVKETLGPTILKSDNKIKVIFYPTPNDSEIATLASGLSVDIGQKQGVEKRKALDEMKEVFQNNLAQIYQEVIKENNFHGCDIWDFFSNKKVDQLCVKKGARNIIVILTDGYLYEEKNKIKLGNAYNYILPKTLHQQESLIDKRNGELKNQGIEILMLEVNPYQPADRDKMVNLLENWFASMGVEKYVVAETDANIPNTKTIIQNFLDN